MKIKVIILGLLSFVVFGNAFAQVEQDDMYFNAKDRAKLREAEKSNSIAYTSSRKAKERDEDSNPTDSYSARNVNPEYTSRAQSQTSQSDEEDYYVANYRYANQSYYNNFNSNYNNWYNNPWYRSNYWGSSIYGWNSPYYGSPYDAWGSPWGNPYYRSSWSSGFSFYYGNSWNYGWNNCFSCSPYAYYDPYMDFYNPYYAYGYNPYMSFGRPYYYGGGAWNRPYRVVYIENDDYRGNYGKRNSRSSQLSRDSDQGTRTNGRIVDGRDGRTNSGGRVNREQEHYNSTWRNTNRSNTNSSYSTPPRTSTPSWNNNNSNNSGNSRSSWESQQRSTPSYSPSPSRSSDAGRSSSPPSGGSSGSGSRSSRGRD